MGCGCNETPSSGEGSGREFFQVERAAIHELLASNPNYFGTAPELDFPVKQPIKYDTTYEELTCVGLWPERNLLEATLVVKLPFGFGGDTCSRGSYEYVRFFIDWDNDGDFTGPNEDLGVAAVNVHDIPQVRRHHLCYAVRRAFRPLLADCRDPYIVRLRGILSWQVVPTGPDFVPIWGNVLECWVQIDPVEGRVLGVVSQSTPAADAESPQEQKPRSTRRRRPEKERAEFLELLEANPNYFGTLPISQLEPVNPIKSDTRYEELRCIGLYPERNFLEAVLQVKLPYGFGGDLCTPGTHEYVRFFIDWKGDGDYVDFSEDEGVAAVNVHDIAQVREFHLCYAVGRRFRALRATCQKPRIVKVRAILSWQQVPTGPNFVPVWGNVVDCWVQIRPTHPTPDSLVGVITNPAASSPPACMNAGPVPACSVFGVTISGSAGGSGFASYRIEYRTLGSATWIQAGVVYPDCADAATTPDHTTPRFGEPLAYLTGLEPDEYEVRLRVDGVGGPIFAFTQFALQRAPVVIDKLGQVEARVVGPHPVDASEVVKLIKQGAAPGDPETSVGGAISVVGSADVWGCGREMTLYALEHQEAPFGSPPPEEDDAGPWAPVVPPLPFGISDPAHPRWYANWCLLIALPNFVLNGKLTRFWNNFNCSAITPTVRRTEEVAWNTSALNGRYTVRLRVEHEPLGGGAVDSLYDTATAWLDNRAIQVLLGGMAITGGGSLGSCEELSLSQFLGTSADVRGRAWDPLILDTVAAAEKPNDNFDHYHLSFRKAGGASYFTITTSTTRVPNSLPLLPAPPGDIGVLATWDIVAALDAGPPPDPYVPPSDPKIYRGERCAYLIHLSATDKTLVNDAAGTHYGEDFWPFCIVNDLPVNGDAAA